MVIWKGGTIWKKEWIKVRKGAIWVYREKILNTERRGNANPWGRRECVCYTETMSKGKRAVRNGITEVARSCTLWHRKRILDFIPNRAEMESWDQENDMLWFMRMKDLGGWRREEGSRTGRAAGHSILKAIWSPDVLSVSFISSWESWHTLKIIVLYAISLIE